MKIKLIKFPGFCKAPIRKHYNDAGADCYLPKAFAFYPHKTYSLPLGFGVEIHDGYMGLIITRSSIAAKGLVVHIPPIDSGYRGEIHAVITNSTDNIITLDAEDRVAQLVIVPVILAEFVENLENTRGTGAFGSTGK